MFNLGVTGRNFFQYDVEFPRKNGHGYAEFLIRNSTGLI
ncbi:hypothetical protein LEP1GSC161_0301 [Leptospira santarosai str. CBC1416]|uniref:Uncharacterized protein n=1 Tax=Leptospira santarosai str. CBC1416 TaxID=1193059 RepID=M6VIQ8_9LEPT|nr:hypothetical protein LEP1GSC161_0301 [Leptospira santarosai str. CBC1416]